MLALGASHLDKLSSSGLQSVASSHRLLAITGLNEALKEPAGGAEEGDATIAACYALLMQSWYMDDGLNAFLVLMRSCFWVSNQVQTLNIGSVFAHEDLDTRVEDMRVSLRGAPTFDSTFFDTAAASLDVLRPLCQQPFEEELLNCIMDCCAALSQSPFEGMIGLSHIISIC